MRWRGIEVGPRLSPRGAGEIFVGFDSERSCPVALRYFPVAHGPSVPSVPAWPIEPSPNLARTLRILPTGHGAVVESELALGPALELLLRAGAQPAGVAAGLARQALTGLEALHLAGRAHGRIHPRNLILDVDQGCLRIVDLEAAAFEGVPRGLDPSKAYASPIEASPSVRGDLYAVGRVAEALLRGQAPLGAWRPLEAPPAPDGGRFQRFAAWVERCQSLDPSRGFADAAEALAALRGMGIEGEQTVAQVRGGAWVLARRRALRSIVRWRAGGGPGRAGPAEFAEIVSSLRAAALWRRLGFVAVGAVLASAAFVFGPSSTLEGEHWPDSGCAAAAKPVPLGAEAPAVAGSGVIELEGPAGSLVALDGCPIELGSQRLRLGLAVGRHDVRSKIAGRVAAESFSVEPSGPPLALSLTRLPSGIRAEAARPEPSKEVGTSEAREIVLALRAIAEKPPEATVLGGRPIAEALLDPGTLATLEIDRRGDATAAARAALPDALALDLDGLRAADRRLELATAPCLDKLRLRAAAVLAVRQPHPSAALEGAVEAMVATRLADRGERDSRPLESAILDRAGIPESRMLDGAVDEVATDAALGSCLAALAPAAAELSALAERALAEAGVADVSGASGGSAR